MNFSKELKQELLQIKLQPDELKAMLLAFFNLITLVSDKLIIFNTSNKDINNFIQLLIQRVLPNEKIYQHNENEIILKKNNITNLFSLDTTYQENSVLISENIVRIFLRGSFLARGSINNPEKANYHLEIQHKDKANILLIQRKLIELNLNAKITKRRNNYVVYIKEAEKISDFLKIIGANQSLFKFEDYRIDRDFHNSLVKTMNCEIHNTTVATEAANKQLKQIELLQTYHSHLIEEYNLAPIIELREENPQASLNELCTKYYEKYKIKISKSSLFRKFEKIKKILKGEL